VSEYRYGFNEIFQNRPHQMTVSFCTLAIHEPYRRRARLLFSDLPLAPWFVLTDEPDDFADLSVHAIAHQPTGPMAVDYLYGLPPLGTGTAAYHDKRFALKAALEGFDTAVYVDADSRISGRVLLRAFPSGIAVHSETRWSIEQHLAAYGSWRKPVFTELAEHLFGDNAVLSVAHWCPENVVAITKDGRESRFFEAWTEAAEFLQGRNVYSGEGGVIGLAAAYAGWEVNFDSLHPLVSVILHEAGGPKAA
jgi:hypothetical protein